MSNTEKKSYSKYKSDPVRAFFGFSKSFAIYPDFWKREWGPRPLLGYVRADNEFYARYAAYNAGLLIMAGPFGPLAIEVQSPDRKNK